MVSFDEVMTFFMIFFDFPMPKNREIAPPKKSKTIIKKRHYFVKNDHFEHTLASKDQFQTKRIISGSYHMILHW